MPYGCSDHLNSIAAGSPGELKTLEKFIGSRATRRDVVEAAMEAEGAFTSDELYQITRRRRPTIGRATIYRTLCLLLQHGHLRKIVLQNGQHVYQRVDDSRRMLWICDDCSRINCLDQAELCSKLKFLGEQQGLHPMELTVEVHFRCEQMRRNGSCPR